MTVVQATAPAKAILSGEYAVLTGAPAIALALGRLARVTVRPAEGRSVARHHTLTAPGFRDGRWRFRVGADGNFAWLDEQPERDTFRLLETVWRCVRPTPDTALSIELDTREFHDERGRKFGLGGSAALTVATAAALLEASDTGGSVLPIADDAHRAFQGGHGSGVDIAAAFHGGVVEFRRGAGTVRRTWPDELSYRIFWSGRPADTRDRIERAGGGSGARSASELTAASQVVASAIADGSGSVLMRALRDYVDCLGAFDLDRGLGIFEAGHRELAAYAAARDDVIYKPCGAGGGDIGIAVSGSAAAIEDVAARAGACGFVELDVAIERQGVCVRVA